MGTIAKVDAAAVAGIAKESTVAVAGISKYMGQDWPSGSSWIDANTQFYASFAADLVDDVIPLTGTAYGDAAILTADRTFGATNVLRVGANSSFDANRMFDGKIDSVRISNVARYTSNFTAPTEAFSSDANTVFLAQYDSDLNSSVGGWTGTASGNAAIQSGTVKFGANSLECDGTGDYVSYSDDAGLNLSGNFTIEGWFYTDAASGTSYTKVMLAKQGTNLSINGYLLEHYQGNVWFSAGSQASGCSTTGAPFSAGAWHHVAAVKSDDHLMIFVDGVLEGEAYPYETLNLDGAGDYVQFPSDSAFTWSSGEKTIEFWVYLDAASGAGYTKGLVSTGTAAAGDKFTIGHYQNRPTFYVNGTNMCIDIAANLTVGSWHHLAFVYWNDSGTYRYLTYIDGADRYQNSNTTRATTADVMNVGNYQPVDTNRYSDCKINDLRISNIARYSGTSFTPPTRTGA
jgi:hypothetical protein